MSHYKHTPASTCYSPASATQVVHSSTLQPGDEEDCLCLVWNIYKLSQLVGDVLDLVQGDGKALDQFSHHTDLPHLEVLLIAVGTDGYLGADQHPVKLPPVVHQGVLELGHILLLVFAIQPSLNPIWCTSPNS